MANVEPNMGRDAERADGHVVDATRDAERADGHVVDATRDDVSVSVTENLDRDVAASKSVMNVRSRLNRLFLLAIMATSAFGCREQEHAHAKDFATALDPNENQCRAPDPNGVSVVCRRYGPKPTDVNCNLTGKDPEAEKLRIFDDATLAVMEKWSKRSPEERKRYLDVFANSGRRLLDKTPQATGLPGYSTVDKDASIIRLPKGFTFPSGPICPEGKMIFWTPRRLQKAK